ncbi:MAG TPA: hypothetical protein VED86_05315 [archaeon]|nr:hypothetical protein [archaeon]
MRRRIVFIPIGIIIILMGSVWFLQGIGTLPGSVMSGSQFWAVAGGLAVIVGLALIVAGATKRGSLLHS